jgi:hypothetical protein
MRTIAIFSQPMVSLGRPALSTWRDSLSCARLKSGTTATRADLIVNAFSRKTIYVRFDLNDYSIPPNAIGRELTLQISPTNVRILNGDVTIAEHRRCWDRHQVIEDPSDIYDELSEPNED